MNRGLLQKMIVLGVFPLVSFILLTYYVVKETTIQLDERIIDFVRTFEHPMITKAMKGFSIFGNTWPVVIISVVLLVIIYRLYRKRDEVILFVIVSLGSTGLNLLLKHTIKRERPSINPLIMETGYSYPSGHSMAAFTLYGMITFLFWRHIHHSMGRTSLVVFSTVMIMVMGVSRIYLGVHYPSDVLGGYLVSGVWLFITIWVYQYRKDQQANKKSSNQ